MKASLLDWIICPECGDSFHLEAMAYGPAVGQEEMSPDREISQGLLLCGECGRWYPVRGRIPELYPDFLRRRTEEISFLDSIQPLLQPRLYRSLRRKARSTLKDREPSRPPNQGAAYKRAEMTIKSKVDDPLFFNPGLFSPFNPGNPEFTGQMIHRFGNLLPLMDLKAGCTVADIGPAYAWTTEWLKRMGMIAIGVDICRTYLEIGLKRMKGEAPHLVLADVEHLPLKGVCLDALLCFDTLHHIFDRKAAMAHFWRVLKEGGNVTLAEPGPEHEWAAGSQQVMEKYGILERGMSLEDLKGYISGLGFAQPEEHFVCDITSSDKEVSLTEEFLRSRAYADCRLYRIKKPLRSKSA
jgi:uncharacterized protein YbaR (Trm112 family)/SAM-dependent methyltransferase